MEDVKSMKENGPSECSIVSEASILNEDRANGAASETSENIDGKMSHEMQASDSCKAEHDDGGGYLEEDQPSPSGNLIISTSSPVNESETGIITFETESPQLEALLPLPENPEPLERRRDENSTALPESLPLSVLDAKPSDSGSLPAAHTQDPAIIQDASPSLPSNSNSDTLKLPEEPISVLPNQSETGPTIASELSTEITSPGNGADTPSTSSHSAREAENDNNAEKRINDVLEQLKKATENDADTCLTSSCEVEGTESAGHSETRTIDASELSKEAISSADTPFASSPQVSKDESDTHSASPPQATQSGNSFMTSGNGGQALAKLSNLFFKTSAAATASKHPENAQIDTAAPFESVKQAVSRFGAIVDWKAHRSQTMERRKFIDHELLKVNEDIPLLKKQCEDADEAKVNVLKELDSTKRLIEELKLNLERAQIEEQQAKQDSELAMLRVEEIELGITDEASTAAKVQLEVAIARHMAAASELKSVTTDLEQLQVDYSLMVSDRDAWVKKAEDAVLASQEVEKTVEDLTIELITLRGDLDAAHAAHLEAEEHRLGAAMAREQDILFWEKEVKQAEEELEKTNQQIETVKDLKSNLDTATALLHDLKAELANYMEAKREAETDGGNTKGELLDPERKTHFEMLAAAESAKKELREVKHNLEKAMDEVNCLRVAATSLKSELEKEKSELSNVEQREGMASIAVASLEVELSTTKSDIALAQVKEKEARERLAELSKQLQEAAREADLAKSAAETAREELRKAKEEAEQVSAAARTVESRLLAARMEIEAAKASEKLAAAAMSALEESDLAQSTNGEGAGTGVTLSLEEYYVLTKKANKAEERAKMRVAAAISQIKVAKQSEWKSLNRLEEVNSELSVRKEGLRIALEKSEKAKKGKLAVEQELRKWRSDHATESHPENPTLTPRSGVEERKESKPEAAPTIHHRWSMSIPSGLKNPIYSKESSISQEGSTKSDTSSEGKSSKKKKKPIIPRVLMFFTKKKVPSKSA
ncbi:PREDICTED: protein WEAK CHLOROPLAST MOVEMENT UNDER BLUE LIGHT 1-like [Ipomoea nil]|uniref:protein WEAK CHLOROPLAST MOVEMENT UNDER BLUE LIGHT 1-like n=1 Tax=Ipomoea nil TaxID=35883 RepID=UPI000901BAD1|nr:PREDICTED: protein WEAK CHLOROPLAST MOVEMENT UNDER BLUE LIGHT 1-like [Ipomoea nil]